MPVIDPYNEEVRARFEQPVHAGDVDAVYAVVIEGEATAAEAGAMVQIAADIEDGIVRAARFRVRGCPHLVAAADLACSLGEGRKVSELEEIAAAQLMDRLDVPRTKTGRIFLIEDALRSIARQYDDTRQD